MDKALWELAQLTIRRISVSSMDNNVYLLTSNQTGEQLLIDAADDAPAIFRLLADASVDVPPGVPTSVVAIATTHAHWDHVRALAELLAETGALSIAGTLDSAEIPVAIDVQVNHLDTLAIGDFTVETIHLRGHTPGSTAFLYRDPDGPAHLFTGDSLFPGGVGNTQKDPARFKQLFADVSERIFDQLPDDTIVHPGHGKGTTLGAERPALPSWLARGW